MRALVLILMGCGSAGDFSDAGSTALSDGGTPRTREALVQLARSEAYLVWHAEPQVHRSTGPHGGSGVRTFINDALYTSLKAGKLSHPPGSIAVKELFDGTTRAGWAIDAKDDDGTWLFFEGFEPQLNQYFFRGTGNLCANCHQAGVDQVLVPASAFP